MSSGTRLAAAALAAAVVGGGCAGHADRKRDVHLGRPRQPATTATSGPSLLLPDSVDFGTPTTRYPGAPFRGLVDPDGGPPGAPLVFRSDVPVPGDLVFVLVVGTDARPGEDPRRGHADSVHLLAVNPRSMQGTVLGFPRDAWVQVPGHGNHKLADAMPMGGPQLTAETIRNLTGLPVTYYVVTGFAGFSALVDELAGVNVFVDRQMNDGYSGARFKPGWHHMNGEQALNYSRDRHDVENGDFTRSLHQGNVILSSLAKMRAEVGDDAGLRRWLQVLLRHVVLDSSPSQLIGLATLARRLDPAAVHNLVVPGRVGYAGAASVVYLSSQAAGIFLDLRSDAVIGAAGPPAPPPPPPTTTTAPTAPTRRTSPTSPPPTSAPATPTTLSRVPTTPPTTTPRTTLP